MDKISTQKQKEKIMLVILTVVLLLTAIVLFFGSQGISTTSISEAVVSSSGSNKLMDPLALKMEKMKGETEPMEKIKKDFISFGSLPIVVGEKGRTNPFLPY